MDDNAEKLELESDEFFSFINILKITTNTFDFRKWLKEYHKINDDHEIFEGYRFFLDTCIRGLLHSIIYENSLDLEEDFTFYRARFVGIELDEIPNTSEKTIFIKNIWNLTRNIRKAKKWNEIIKAIKSLDELFNVIDALFEQHVFPMKGLGKVDALKFSTSFYTYIFLNDTHRGFPHVLLLTPILNFSKSEKYMEKTYFGYVHALQYLWFILLETEEFEDSSLKDLHKAHEIYSEEAGKLIESDIGFLTSDKIGPEEQLLKLKNWFALDMFFGIIKEEIIVPIESKFEIAFTFDSLLLISESFDKKLIRKFLRSDEIKEPKYLETVNSKKMIENKLNYLFFWYDVNVLDAQGSTVFNGVPAFISTIVGNVELSRIFRNDEKVFVRRFKHPVKGVNGNKYSYGILIQAYATIADYSGWLIFFDCATDYSGFGGTLYSEAEKFIEQFSDDDKIEIKEEIIDLETFKKYLAYISTSSEVNENGDVMYFNLDLLEIKRKNEDFIGNAKGKFFEYLFSNWLIEENHVKYKKIICDHTENNEQIDVIAENETEIHVFECKYNLHNDEIKKIRKQIWRKVNVMKGSDKEIIPHLVFFSQIQNSDRKKFQKEGIHVFTNFRETINNWRKLSTNSTKAIMNIFDYENPADSDNIIKKKESLQHPVGKLLQIKLVRLNLSLRSSACAPL